MNLTLLIIINVILDTAIIGALAFVMSRSAQLTPHLPGEAPRVRRLRRPKRSPSGDRVPAGARLSNALD